MLHSNPPKINSDIILQTVFQSLPPTEANGKITLLVASNESRVSISYFKVLLEPTRLNLS